MQTTDTEDTVEGKVPVSYCLKWVASSLDFLLHRLRERVGCGTEESGRFSVDRIPHRVYDKVKVS